MIVHDDLLKEAAAAAMLEEVPTELVENEIETTTEKLLASSQAVGEISRNVEKVGVFTESLESYVSRFMETVPEGEWNARTARQFQLGMGSILATTGVALESSAYCSSFEAVGKTEGADENRSKTKEKSEGLVKRMYEALKAAIRSFIESLGTYISNFKNNIASVDKLARNLESRAKSAKGTADKKEFEGTPKWSQYLHQGSNTLSPKAALDVTGQSLVDVCKGWEAAFIGQAFATLMSQDSGKSTGDAGDDAFSLPASKFGEWPGLKTVSLEGNKFSDAVLKVTDSSATLGTSKVTVLSVADVVQLAIDLKTLHSKLVMVSQDLGKAVVELKAMESKLTENSADKTSPAQLGRILSRVVLASRVLTPVAIENARNAYRHGDASLKLLK